MVHLTVGLGEVGKAINTIVGGSYVTRHKSTWKGQNVDVAHICIPYDPQNPQSFIETVELYKTKANLVIVHSSVPVGTCDRLGVVHSPIRGVHPNLVEGVFTFVKYFGGERAKEAAWIFEKLGIETKVFKKARTSEALKLWDTTQYGVLILLEKSIYKWAKENDVDFDDIYTQANKDYNAGYTKLGRPDVVRPWLKHIPGPIGGHCVIPNSKLLGKDFEIPEKLDLP